MSDSIPDSGPRVVAAGVVRVGDDLASDLRVQVKVENETISLRTDVLEVGSWPIRDFSVKKITADRFVISIDGETLSFYPDEPNEFRRLDFVGRKRLGRSRRTKADQPAAVYVAPNTGPCSDRVRFEPRVMGAWQGTGPRRPPSRGRQIQEVRNGARSCISVDRRSRADKGSDATGDPARPRHRRHLRGA